MSPIVRVPVLPDARVIAFVMMPVTWPISWALPAFAKESPRVIVPVPAEVVAANLTAPLLTVRPPEKVLAALSETKPAPVVLTTNDSTVPVPSLIAERRSKLKLFFVVRLV